MVPYARLVQTSILSKGNKERTFQVLQLWSQEEGLR